MNKKEIAEIKKQFTPDRCAITRICGCYVNSEKEKQLEYFTKHQTYDDEWNVNRVGQEGDVSLIEGGEL